MAWAAGHERPPTAEPLPNGKEMTVHSRTLTLASCAIHCLDSGGEGDREIVLLHGMKFQAATWQELGTLDILADQNLRALALDMPGFGRSPACETSSDSILHDLVRSECRKPPVLLGPSMGGRIAMEYAIAHPSTLAGLILVGPVGIEENRGQLQKIDVPTLLIWGEEDQVSPLDGSDILLAGLGKARLEVIPGAPHPCYLDHSRRFHDLVLDFCGSLT